MKRVFIDLIVIIFSMVIANYTYKICIYIMDKLDLISDNSRLMVLFVPFIVYGFILFAIDSYIINKIISFFFSFIRTLPLNKI